MNTIFPTHHCFDDVLEHQVELRSRDPLTAARQLIVHGICLAPEGPHAGEPFAHAWVEDPADGTLYQAGLLEDGTRIWWGCAGDEWRAKLRVQAATRYTLQEALIKNWQTGHFGPWQAEYAALVRTGDRRVFVEPGQSQGPTGAPSAVPRGPQGPS